MLNAGLVPACNPTDFSPNAVIVSLYAFSVVCAALLLGMSRHPWAAFWCATPPLAGLAYFAVYGFHPNLGTQDKVLLVAAMIAWLAYDRRLLAITRAYPSLPQPSAGD